MSDIRVLTLDCGLPLVVERIPAVKSAGVSIFLPAGSATDPDDRQGLSAMFSELVFRGAGDLDSRAQADAFDRAGANRGCSVGTFYLKLSLSTLGARLADALPLLADIIRRPRFEQASIDPVRDLSLQAIESLADDPHERASLTARERFFPSPINRSGLGTVEGLTNATRDDLLHAWAQRIRPRNSIMAIAGDVDADAIATQLNRLLTGWEGQAEDVTWGSPTTRGTYHHVDDKSAQVQIIALHEAPPEPHPDSVLERIVTTILSGGMSARLFTEVREKRGLCYSVHAGYATDRLFGRCMAYVGTTPERAQESLDVLVSELRRINGTIETGGGVDQSELERARIGLKSSLIFSGESTGARAAALASDMHRLGRPRSLDEINAAIERVTLDDVNAYLARRRIEGLTIVTLGPKSLKAPA